MSREHIEVVAAAIVNPHGECLVTLRPDHVHQGGKWEFPGGKIEPGESPSEALARELHEELGIVPSKALPLISLRHDYADKSVQLDVWQVDRFEGVPHGREGQPLRWVPIQALRVDEFPAANRAIIHSLQLPDRYLITPELGDEADFLRGLEAVLASGVRLVQLRAKRLQRPALAALARQVRARVHAARGLLLLNADLEMAMELGADGVHLPSEALLALDALPVQRPRWVAASCHDEREVEQANRLGLDFIVISPVRATPSHPESPALGLDRFQLLCAQACMPVYALGGMTVDDIDAVRRLGGQGVAAIRALWGQGA
jgi:8-oxo-dGTP diphosphatase